MTETLVEPDLIISVSARALVFESARTQSRSDLNAAGLLAGEGLDEIVEEARRHVPQWPNAMVAIAGEEAACDVLVAHFQRFGVQAFAAEVIDDAMDTAEADTADSPAVQPGTARPPKASHRVQRTNRIQDYLIDNVKVILLVVAMVAITAMGLFWLLYTPPQITATPVATSSTTTTPSTTAPTTTAPTTTPVILEHARLKVTLPYGYRLEQQDGPLDPAAPESAGMITATGQDPNLRILLSADPLFGLAVDQVEAELHRMVSEDEQLSMIDPVPVEGRGRTFSYREDPGDGSSVEWTTWVEHDHLFSVGCHTRQASTLAQRAACRMAATSLALTPHSVT